MSPTEPTHAESSHQTKGLLRLTMACNERCTFCNVPVEDYEVVTPTLEQNADALGAFVERGSHWLAERWRWRRCRRASSELAKQR